MKDNRRGRITSKDTGVLLGGQQMQNANENDNGRDLKKFILAITKIVFHVLACVCVCMLMRTDYFALQNSLNYNDVSCFKIRSA